MINQALRPMGRGCVADTEDYVRGLLRSFCLKRQGIDQASL
jgi:hypothetical protein